MPNEKGSILRKHPYDEAIAQRICDLFGEGRKMADICAEVSVPKESLVVWLARYPAFLEMYTRAKELRADQLIEEAMEIADDDSHDWKDIKGRLVPDWENVQRSRLKVDTRMKVAKFLAPQKYGDKLEITGGMEVRHIDQTTHGMQLRLLNIIEDGVRRGLDKGALLAKLGLNEINFGKDFPKLEAAPKPEDKKTSKKPTKSIEKTEAVDASFVERQP